MASDRTTTIVFEAQMLREALKTRPPKGENPAFGPIDGKRSVLLQMVESLIEAHRLAKTDDNGFTLALIEDALVHVGWRLVKEA